MAKYRIVKIDDNNFYIQKRKLFGKWLTIDFFRTYEFSLYKLSTLAEIDVKPKQILIESK